MVGGNRLTYEHETAAQAANLLEAKIMPNSTISTTNVKFLTIYIKDFFLSSKMPQPEYMKMHWDEIPNDIKNTYSLQDKVDPEGHVHFRINKGMYGLKQAAILAYNQLKSNLAPHGYRPIPNTVGMWKHNTKHIKFCLCVATTMPCTTQMVETCVWSSHTTRYTFRYLETAINKGY